MRARQELVDHVADAMPGLHLIVIGVDRFARVRRAIGYDLAEDPMRELAARVGVLTGETLIVRLAPDTLGVRFVHPLEAPDSLLSLIHAALEQPVMLAGHRIDASISIRYSVGVAGEDLLQQAEIALDQSRRTA